MAKTIIYNSATASTVFDTDVISVDESTGDIYVHDKSSSIIYKIASGGAITTFLTGYVFNRIKFIGGHLYGSQYNNGSATAINNIQYGGIFKIVVSNSSTFTTSTFAGGSTVGYAGSALNQLNHPWGIAVDSSGNIYVADANNHRIQKFLPNHSPSTNATVFAGGNGYGSAANKLNYPRFLAFDSSGNLCVSDNANQRIIRFPSNSTSSTNGTIIAGGNGQGSALNQFTNVAGIAFDSSGNLYVADSTLNKIVKFPSNSTSSTNGTVVAGGNGSGSSANQFNYPTDISFDSSGNLYVVDQNNNRIQKFPSNSTQSTNGTTVAGGNGQGFSLNQFWNPQSISFDSSGSFYVPSVVNASLKKFPPNSTQSTNGVNLFPYGAGSGSNQLYSPASTVFDSSGNMYIADRFNSRIQKVTFASQTSLTQITQTAGNSGSGTNQITTAFGFHIFNNDESYVANTYYANGAWGGRIMHWTSSSSTGTQLVGGLGTVMDVTVDTSGNLIVLDQGNFRVLKFTKTGTNIFNQTPTVIAGGNGQGSALNQLSAPWSIISNSDNSVIILDSANNRVVKWTSGATAGIVLSSGYGNTGKDLYQYANGDLLISNASADTITLDTGLTAAPTMAITSTIASGSTSGTSAITMTFTSSLATANFTVNDITVSGGALSSFSSTSTTVYTATFTPSGDGSKSISVGANSYTDSAWGNSNTASNTFAYTVSSPPVTSSTSLTSNNALGATKAKVGDVVTLTFGTDVGVSSPTVVFTSGGQAITNSVSVNGNINLTSWTATYTVHASDTEGAVGISITATSSGGFGGPGSSPPPATSAPYTTIGSGSVTLDKTAPVWSGLAPSSSTSVNTSAVQYTLSEALSSGTVTFNQTGGSAASNVVVALTGAELNAGAKSLGVLTNAPTLVNNAIYSILFNGVDLSGNASSTATKTNITFSNVLPTITSVTSTTTDGRFKAGDDINITVNFSDSVTLSGGSSPTMVVTLETGSTDRTVSFTSISNVSSVSGTYTVQAGDTSSDLAVQTISVSDGNISNAAGNMTNFTVGSNLSSTSDLIIDTTAPVISGVSPASSSTVLNKEIGYTLSEQCASGTITFTRTGGTADSGSPHTVNLVSSELTSGVHAPAELSNNPTLVSESVYSIAFNATDLAGNAAITVTNTGITYSTDTTAPTIIISSNDVNSGGLSNLETIVLIFTISEVVTNFVIGDITVSGGALSGFTSGKYYFCTFTPSGDGVKTIDVAAGAFTDGSNNNLAATQFSYTYDGTKPTVAITSSEVSHNGSYGGNQIGLTFTTSEATTNFVKSDIVVSNGVLSNFTAISSTVYTATFTATINDVCNINVYSNVFTDAANNQNTSSVFIWTKTGTAPTVIISSTINNNATTTSNPLPITFTLSASSSNFVSTDVVVSGGVLSGFSGSGTTYTATYTASSSTTHSILVPPDSFTNSDSVGNERGSFVYTLETDRLSPALTTGIINFVRRNVLTATITTENEQSSSLKDINFYYENGVISADVLLDGGEVNGLEMIGTQIEIELELEDNTVPDVIESVMIGSWMSLGH